MRIVEINMLHYGSTGSIMLNIAKAAKRHGHEVWTFSPRNYQRGSKMEEPMIENHSYFGFVFENMINNYFSKFTGFQGFLSCIGTHHLIRELKKIKPDVVHLHNLHNRSMCLPMLFGYLKRQNVRVIWTLHDCWAMTGQCPHFTIEKCDKWKSGCHNCNQIHVYPEALVDQTKIMWRMKKKWFSNFKFMTLVTPSRWLADLVNESYLKEYSIQVINNGINLDVFKPQDSTFRERYNLGDKYVLLGVAFDWGNRKGLDVFIELANRLDSRYQIILVGTNSNIDLQLPENIISIHRTQNQEELADIYSAADLFINPTREETYPTVNMEALACGTPVLTFHTGGSPEILDETCGSVVDCDDINALEQEVFRILYTKPYSKDNCIKRASMFDMNERFEDYVRLYEKVFITLSTCDI